MSDHRAHVSDWIAVKFNRKAWSFNRQQLVELPEATVIKHWTFTIRRIDAFVVISYNPNPAKCCVVFCHARDGRDVEEEIRNGERIVRSAGWNNHKNDYPLRKDSKKQRRLDQYAAVFNQQEEDNGTEQEDEYSYRSSCEIIPRDQKGRGWHQQKRELL
jgi:hypothetical protein